MTTSSPLSGWHYRVLLLTVTSTALAYLGFSLWGGWREVWTALNAVGVAGLVLILTMSLLNYGLRFLRWQYYLRLMNHTIPWSTHLAIYLSGFALTTSPAKAGEALRGVLLKPFAVPYPDSFAAFFSERLSDVVAIILLCLLGLSQYPDASPFVMAATGVVLFSLFVLSKITLLSCTEHLSSTSQNRFFRFLKHVLSVLHQARQCHTPTVLTVATLLSLLAWGAEAVAFYWVLHWMGADISLGFAAFIYAISMLAGAATFLPGGLGGAEAVMTGLLIYKGMPTPDAVAATVLIRIVTLWFAVLIGFFLVSRFNPDIS